MADRLYLTGLLQYFLGSKQQKNKLNFTLYHDVGFSNKTIKLIKILIGKDSITIYAKPIQLGYNIYINYKYKNIYFLGTILPNEHINIVIESLDKIIKINTSKSIEVNIIHDHHRELKITSTDYKTFPLKIDYARNF